MAHVWKFFPAIFIFSYFSKSADSIAFNQCCPPLWAESRGNCYRYWGQLFTWDEGEQFCRKQAPTPAIAHLVSIHDEYENTFVNRLWRTAQQDPDQLSSLWIGLNDRAKPNVWIWSDNTAANFTNWKVGEPSGDGDCGHQFKYAKAVTGEEWNDRRCDFEAPIICKIPTSAFGYLHKIQSN